MDILFDRAIKSIVPGGEMPRNHDRPAAICRSPGGLLNCPTMRCSRCRSESYGSRSAFCTRCGASLNPQPSRLRYYNAPSAPRTGWKSLPFVVRLAIYIVCIPPIIGATFWAILILIGLTPGSR